MPTAGDRFLLALNVGSSSLKFAAFRGASKPEQLFSGKVDGIGGGEAKLTLKGEATDSSRSVDVHRPEQALDAIQQEMTQRDIAPVAVAHRVVHGGELFGDHCPVTVEMLDRLGSITDLAPNHLPVEIALMRRALEVFPAARHIACFDTVFHRELPAVARNLPVPRHLWSKGVRRYGFHGLSCAYIMEALVGRVPEEKRLGRVIIAHLGSGASLTALRRGRSIDTTMGLTPLGGVVMATRSGELDPGIGPYLERAGLMPAHGFEHMAYAESGMKGVSETSGDVRALLAHEGTDSRAADALNLFCYSVRKAVGALAAALEGVDLIVFTGGIGENAAPIRQRICEDLEWLGLSFDHAANRGSDSCISAPASKVWALVVPTDEEAYMAQLAWKMAGEIE